MDKRVHTFQKGIGLKVNVIAWLEFELVTSRLQSSTFSHYALFTEIMAWTKCKQVITKIAEKKKEKRMVCCIYKIRDLATADITNSATSDSNSRLVQWPRKFEIMQAKINSKSPKKHFLLCLISYKPKFKKFHWTKEWKISTKRDLLGNFLVG